MTTPASKLTGQGISPVESAQTISDVDDSVLVEQTLAGKAEAFETLFARHRQRLFAVAWRLLQNEDSALDVVQDAFVQAYEQLAHLKRECQFFPWIRRIAVNLAIDQIRHTRRNVELSLNGKWAKNAEQGEDRMALIADKNEAHNPVAQAELAEFSEALSTALLKLSDTQRTVFMLHAAEGMSYQEIAAALNCNLGTVMSRLFYARKRLQELLRPHLKEV
ncbi:MAG: RNA polymerase sigma factor [Planctomycetota bacterium]